VSRRRERGVALVAAVSALAVLVVLATGLAYTTAVDQHLARSALQALQADALARSGVAAAAVLLGEQAERTPIDTLRAPWAEDPGRQPLGAGWVAVHVEDEARRLDLGSPELAPTLPRLLAVLGLEPRLADAIADWVDTDDVPRPGGAERDFYLGLHPPYLPANTALASVGELRLVRGVDARVLTRLAPFVTTAGEAAVNPNTAPREVLLAVADGFEPAGVDALLAARGRRAVDPAAELPSFFPHATPEALAPLRRRLAPRGTHYSVRVTAGVGEMRRAAEATLSVPPGAAPRVVGWRPRVAELESGETEGGVAR
jgi:general secretion pathway protein K